MRNRLRYTVLLTLGSAALFAVSYWSFPVLIKDGPSVFSALLCRETGIAPKTPVVFQWKPESVGGRFLLRRGADRVLTDKNPSYLLITAMEPALDGIRLPVIIRSDDPTIYQTLSVSEPTLKIRAETSYGMLAAGLDDNLEQVLEWPVRSRQAAIGQANGLAKGRKTHSASEGKLHAVDISGKIGDAVLAARSGVVVETESRYPDYGCLRKTPAERPSNKVTVLHADGSASVYAHLKQGSVRVRVGQRVSPGQVIGEIGLSGWTSGPHLHFELGGLTLDGYKTLPVVFRCHDGSTVRPIPGGTVCPYASSAAAVTRAGP